MDENGNQLVTEGVVDVATGDSGTTPASTEVVSAGSEDTSISRDDFVGLSKFIKRDTENNSAVGVATATTPATDDSGEDSVTTEEAGQPAPATSGPADGSGTTVEGTDANQDIMESISAAELAELRKGAMLQADYTRKTQELAEERRNFAEKLAKANSLAELPVDDAMDLWNSLSLDPVGTIRYLEQYYAEQGVVEPKDPEVLKVEQALANEQKKNKELADQLQDEAKTKTQVQFDQYMTELSTKYKDDGFDSNEVIQFCLDSGITNPEMAFKIMQHDKLLEKNQELSKQLEEKGKAAVSEYVKEKATEAATFTPPVGAGNTSSGMTVSKPRTFADSRKAALARNFD